MTATLKKRKLYEVRVHPHQGLGMGRHVGFKGRLLTRNAASRVVKRLSASGLFATMDAMHVNLTPLQASWLDTRERTRALRGAKSSTQKAMMQSVSEVVS